MNEHVQQALREAILHAPELFNPELFELDWEFHLALDRGLRLELTTLTTGQGYTLSLHVFAVNEEVFENTEALKKTDGVSELVESLMNADGKDTYGMGDKADNQFYVTTENLDDVTEQFQVDCGFGPNPLSVRVPTHIEDKAGYAQDTAEKALKWHSDRVLEHIFDEYPPVERFQVATE